MKRIYMSSPDIGQLEEDYVVDAIRSGWVAPLGPHVDGFEHEAADRTGTSCAVALSSGTAALHLALVSWGVGPGDVIPTSTMTFAATANAITYTGATPYFVDCEGASGNIDPALLDHGLTELKAAGRHVPAIVPVDLLGKCANYGAIAEIAERHGVKVLSDAAESLGASSFEMKAGSFGDAAILSFNGNKVMTTSGGGMLLTNDKALADHVRFLSTQAREPAVHYEHQEIGYNYRMSNVLAALGRAQLQRLDDMIAVRRERREAYADRFSAIPGVSIFGRDGDQFDNCWLTAVLIDEDVTGWAPDALRAALDHADIESRPLWKPMHLQPVFADAPRLVNGQSEQLFKTGLTLPSGSSLAKDDIGRVDEAISSFLASHR